MIRRGLTVIEVLIAIGILAMLSGALSAFLWDVDRQRQLLGRLGEERLASNLLIERLDAATRYATVSGPSGERFVGTPNSLTIPYRVVELAGVEGEPAALAGAQALSLQWDEGQAQLTLQGAVLTSRAVRVVLRYHDGDGWRDSFDAQQVGGLPTAIEVALWFGDADAALTGAGEDPGVGPALGEGFGLPTPSEFDDLLSEGAAERVWGEPDRRRVFSVLQLRSGISVSDETGVLP